MANLLKSLLGLSFLVSFSFAHANQCEGYLSGSVSSDKQTEATLDVVASEMVLYQNVYSSTYYEALKSFVSEKQLQTHLTGMADDALMQPKSRQNYRMLLSDGWTDALRSRHPAGKVWTYWDYQAGAWQRDAGFRIDHLLLSPQAADRLVDAQVDKDYRGREKASDHAPTWVELRA